MSTAPVLVNGHWVASSATQTFRAINPKTREVLSSEFPISPWSEVEQVLVAATKASFAVNGWSGSRFGDFLDQAAIRITGRAEEIVAKAHEETGLPVSPRLKDVELPRTTNQLHQAALAARDGSWSMATIDRKTNIRSLFGPIGPVAVFGPNNFPFAYNGICGGDFATAVAAGNPVIAKAHSSHPETSRLLAEEVFAAAQETGMPAGFVQMIYRTSHEDGVKLASHPLLGAIGYTGGRGAGLKLKVAADSIGKPFYAELSSINPVFLLPGAIAERGSDLAAEFSTSCLMGCGQFCTNPGLVFVIDSAASQAFVADVASRFHAAPTGPLLGEAVLTGLVNGVETLVRSGAELRCGGKPIEGAAVSFQNTLLTVKGEQFLRKAEALQTEAFGNVSLIVQVASAEELLACIEHLEGNLTGSIYSAKAGGDDELYGLIEPPLRRKVGRLLNDKMPTGVAVVASMNHGGPFPATGHPGFTAVGIPAAIHRFGALHCYDAVRPERLPVAIQDKNPTGKMWRMIDGGWSQGDA